MGNAVSALGAFCVGASLAFPFLYGCLLQRYWLAVGAAWVTMMGVAMTGGAAAEAAAKPQPGALFWSLFGGGSLLAAVGVVRLMFGEWPTLAHLTLPETPDLLWAIQAGAACLLLAYPLVQFVVARSGDLWRFAAEGAPDGPSHPTIARLARWYPAVWLLCNVVAWLAWAADWRWAAVVASAAPFVLASLALATLVYYVTGLPSPPPAGE